MLDLSPTVRRFHRIFALIFLLAAPAVAQPDSREAELAAIRQEIARLEGRVAAIRGRETTLEDQLKRLELELELQEVQLSEATAAFELAADRSAAAEAEVERLETALAAIRGDLRRRLAGLYRLGRHGYLRLFLALKPDSDLLPAIRQLRFLVRRDQLAVERYTATRRALLTERERLAAERRQMELWRQREQERRDALADARRRRQRTLERMAGERRRLAARASALQEKERKLARLIASLVEGRLEPLGGTPIQDFRGALDWPFRGEVTSGFGPRKDPRYRTEVPHNGIDLATPPGARIRVVYPGEVLYASTFEGYGLMAVVHHPGKAFTLYAGLGELEVEKGDVLSLGQAVGTATDALYFEIRLENQPQDPLEWLR